MNKLSLRDILDDAPMITWPLLVVWVVWTIWSQLLDNIYYYHIHISSIEIVWTRHELVENLSLTIWLIWMVLFVVSFCVAVSDYWINNVDSQE